MKREGFTLIELLMVIVIIALMTAILIPLLSNSRLRAQAIKCNSNLKQLFTRMTIYHDENGTFPNAYNFSQYTLINPPSGGYAGDASYDLVGWWWFNYVTDYSKRDFNQDSIVWCPSRKITESILKRNVLCANYGVNQSICKETRGERRQPEFVGKPLGISDIKRPSETLLIVDSGYSMINWWHVTDIPPEPLLEIFPQDFAYIPGLKINKDKKQWPGLRWDATNGRHSNKAINIVFVDGHVDVKEADYLFVEKTQAGYSNCYPLWQPTKIFKNYDY